MGKCVGVWGEVKRGVGGGVEDVVECVGGVKVR